MSREAFFVILFFKFRETLANWLPKHHGQETGTPFKHGQFLVSMFTGAICLEMITAQIYKYTCMYL